MSLTSKKDHYDVFHSLHYYPRLTVRTKKRNIKSVNPPLSRTYPPTSRERRNAATESSKSIPYREASVPGTMGHQTRSFSFCARIAHPKTHMKTESLRCCTFNRRQVLPFSRASVDINAGCADAISEQDLDQEHYRNPRGQS